MTQAKQQDMTFLTGMNAEYIAHLYGEYLNNPSRVDESWRSFFKGLNDTEADLLLELSGASWTPKENVKQLRAFGAVPDQPANDYLNIATGSKKGQAAKGLTPSKRGRRRWIPFVR